MDGSAAEGRKQTNQTLKLMLRAFNGESDAAVAKVKYNNVKTMETRIRKAYELVNSLVAVQRATLAHEYQEKLQAEKSNARYASKCARRRSPSGRLPRRRRRRTRKSAATPRPCAKPRNK